MCKLNKKLTVLIRSVLGDTMNDTKRRVCPVERAGSLDIDFEDGCKTQSIS